MSGTWGKCREPGEKLGTWGKVGNLGEKFRKWREKLGNGGKWWKNVGKFEGSSELLGDSCITIKNDELIFRF